MMAGTKLQRHTVDSLSDEMTWIEQYKITQKIEKIVAGVADYSFSRANLRMTSFFSVFAVFI
jgi:hypothetical protein